jgi:hypothetical protein
MLYISIGIVVVNIVICLYMIIDNRKTINLLNKYLNDSEDNSSDSGNNAPGN